MGLGQAGPNGLDWFPGEALQCAAVGWECAPRGLEGCLWAGSGCQGPFLLWGLLKEGLAMVCPLVVVLMVGGVPGWGMCLQGLCWVSQQTAVPSNQQSPQPFPGQSLSTPGGSCSLPRPASTALAKAEPRDLVFPAGISVPSPAGMGWGQVDVAGRQMWQRD